MTPHNPSPLTRPPLDARHLRLTALTTGLAATWFAITDFQLLTHPTLDRPITTATQYLWLTAAPALVGALFLATFLQLLLLAHTFATRPATRAQATLHLLLTPAPLATLLIALNLYARVLQ
jgi:hypothetical protein